MKKIIIFVIMISLFIFSFDYDKNINYDNYKWIEYKDLKRTKLSLNIIDLTSKIKWEKISLSKKMQNTIFPIENNQENYNGLWCNDYWKLRKYDKDQILELYKIDCCHFCLFSDNNKDLIGDYSEYYSNDKIYTVCFNKSDSEKLIYKDFHLRIIDIINKTIKGYLCNFFNYKNPDETEIISPIVNILGEYVFYIEIFGDNDCFRNTYCFYILHRINLKTLEDEYIDFSDYGIYQAAMGVVDGFLPIYDISLNKRYFYFYGESDKESLKYHYNNFNNFNDGLYVYDWWENRLYKVGNIKCDLVMITNNIDDGYVYIRTRLGKDSKTKNYQYDFYRTKNFESLLDEYK
ncbi:MAG TPA: hypothetical protein PK449_03665 [Exilispira sp.]|nr:hypothetical protein [Exilispira sp.]